MGTGTGTGTGTKGTLRMVTPLGDVVRNIGTLLLAHGERHPDLPAFGQKEDGVYRYRTWGELARDVLGFAGLLAERGVPKAARVAFLTENSYARLVAELAVMGSGRVSVPIFAGYPVPLQAELLDFVAPSALIVDDEAQLRRLPPASVPKETLVLRGFDLAAGSEGRVAAGKAALAEPWGDDVCLIMFTSGTSSFPKGVMLTHGNVLSQQKALEILWRLPPGTRFLSYLPWHHSFGGLFERFAALASAGCLILDDSCGKNIDLTLQNFMATRPHVFMSVPKIHQEVVARTLASKTAEAAFFHPELRFVFTAAAPLPLSTSAIFRQKGVPVVEGWGLTETSPCCTLTGLSLERQSGVVGFPIPGVEVRLADDGEILVRGPNVMRGYFKQPDATAKVLSEDGWFATGDVGEVTPTGLKIVSRKDRVFKLSNGEKVYPAAIEEDIRSKCKLVKYAFVFGSGESHPLALLFPNHELIAADQNQDLDTSSCVYPRSLRQLGECLGPCMEAVNAGRTARYEKVLKAMIVDREPSFADGELTPSFKLVPRAIEERYGRYIKCLQASPVGDVPKDAHLVEVPAKKT